MEKWICRCKPLKFTYEKEIVMYAHFKKLDYFSTECIYSPNAYRGYARSVFFLANCLQGITSITYSHYRTYIKDLERVRPRAILDIIASGEALSAKEGVSLPSISTCVRCGYISSQPVCKACVLLQGLNTDQPLLGIRKTSKVRSAFIGEQS